MDRMPHRGSLMAEVANLMHEEIRDGRWIDCLPGVHSLSAIFQVGKGTIEKVDKILQREDVSILCTAHEDFLDIMCCQLLRIILIRN